MGIDLAIPTLGARFVDYRVGIPGDSFNWGPVIDALRVKYFTLHHSVTAQTAKTDGDWKKECDTIANEHLSQGWGGVGYRFIICSNGVVAYVGDLSHGGSAVAGNNDTIFSACMIGDFTKELPTDAQIHSAHDLVDYFLNHMPQYPLLTSWDTSVIGHKDAAGLLQLPGATPTACPGTSWPNDMKSRIKDNVQYSPSNQQPATQPANPPPVVPISTPPPPVAGSGSGAVTPTPQLKPPTQTQLLQDILQRVKKIEIKLGL